MGLVPPRASRAAVTRPEHTKVKRAVALDPQTIERLRRLSARTRVPMAAYIREGIDRVLASPRYVGA